MFNGVVPAKKELNADQIAKLEKSGVKTYELNEANCIKTLKINDKSIASNKLYYHPKKKLVYKVIEVKKEDDKIVFVKLSESISSTELLIENSSEIDSLRDYVYLNLKIFSGGIMEDIVSTKVRLQAKLEDELKDSVDGATGKGVSMFKFFHDSKVVDKEDMLSKLTDIKDGMYLFATTGYSKAYQFKRFAKPYEYPYWGYYGTTIDAIGFSPNKNVVLCGFTIYGTDRDSFELKYKIYVDDAVVEEEDTMT
jgi:hypothetical protein